MPARILVIEDDHASRELLRYLLAANGYEVLLASDGEVGARTALEAKPDLILCDLQMPILDGYKVMRQLKQSAHWHRVPIVAVTAFSMEGDRETAIAAGFDGYFSKPIDPGTFVRQIEEFLPARLRVPRPAENR